MVYSHKNQTKALVALGICLNADGLGIMRMHVFHTCQKDMVILQNFGEGFVVEVCPMCNETFFENKVEYDLELVIKYGIRLEE